MASPEREIREMIETRVRQQDAWLEERGLDPKRAQTIYTDKGKELYRYIADNNSKSILVSANEYDFEEIPYDKIVGCEIQNDGFTSNGAERATVSGIVCFFALFLVLLLFRSDYNIRQSLSVVLLVAIPLSIALPIAIIGALTAKNQIVRHRIAFLLNDPEMEYRTLSILAAFEPVGSDDYLAAMRFSQNVRLSVLSIVNSRGKEENV